MNNFLLLLIIILIAGVTGVGMLAPGFFLEVQQMIIFHKADVASCSCEFPHGSGFYVPCQTPSPPLPLCP